MATTVAPAQHADWRAFGRTLSIKRHSVRIVFGARNSPGEQRFNPAQRARA
jgi:hypothetical protein